MDNQQNEIEEFDDKTGFTYKPLGNKLNLFERTYSLGKLPFTILFSAQVILPVIIIILQITGMILVSSSQSATTVAPAADTVTSCTDTCASWMRNGTAVPIDNITRLLQEVNDIAQVSSDRLSNIIRTLSNLEESNAGTKGAVDDILLVAEQLLHIQNKTAIFQSHIPVSCQDIRNTEPDSPSGYYHINSQLVYCEMGELCGSTGGWTRLAYLDMSDSAVKCPPGFKYYHNGDVRACGRPNGGASCASVKFPSNGIMYAEACGRVTGYQRGSPDAADNNYINTTAHNDINSFYIDGVSITYGYPRTHVWSMMAGYSDTVINLGTCPCSNGSNQAVQSFVGDDYFCESGNHGAGYKNSLYTADPLWDGQDCGTHEQACCKVSGIPWFHKTFDSTSEYMELRVCGDEPVNANEDTPVSLYEIYVK